MPGKLEYAMTQPASPGEVHSGMSSEAPDAATSVVARSAVHGSFAIPGRHSHTVVAFTGVGGADRAAVVQEVTRQTSTNRPTAVSGLAPARMLFGPRKARHSWTSRMRCATVRPYGPNKKLLKESADSTIGYDSGSKTVGIAG